MDFFPDAAVREAHWTQLEALLEMVEEEGVHLDSAREVCEKYNADLSAILRTKGCRASLVIKSIYMLKKLLNQELDNFESSGFENVLHEMAAAGNISKMGAKKAMHTKVLMTHAMMKELGKCVDTQALAEHGHLVWDLTSWKDPSLKLQCWKREPKDSNVHFYGVTDLTVVPANTKLYVHAIDFAYDDDDAVKRTILRTDVVRNACNELGPDKVAEHLQRVFVKACDLLRAIDTRYDHISEYRLGFPVDCRYKIPVWISRWDGRKDKDTPYTSLDENYAFGSKRALEKNTAQASSAQHSGWQDQGW
jgi:hypothetical protein